MEILVLFLLIVGLVCFLFAAFSPVQPARPSLMPLGLAAWILCVIIDAAQHLHA